MADNTIQTILQQQQAREAAAQAQVKLAQLKLDQGFVERYMRGDLEANRTMRDLQAAIAGVPTPGLTPQA